MTFLGLGGQVFDDATQAVWIDHLEEKFAHQIRGQFRRGLFAHGYLVVADRDRFMIANPMVTMRW